MGKKSWFLGFCFLMTETLMACRETYRVRLSDHLEKSYEIVDPASGEAAQIAYIDFVMIQKLFLQADSLKKRLPDLLESQQNPHPQANILGAFVARDAGLPWVTDQAKKIFGKRIVLLDDVLSSGETMGAAAQLVKAVDAHILSILVSFMEGEDRSSLVVDEKSYPILKIGHLSIFPKGSPEDLS